MKDKIIDELISIHAIKFGDFTLKSGIQSPIYIDLRILVSYPRLMSDLAQIFFELSEKIEFDLVSGIPYTALPIATLFSQLCALPMIYCRKEKKSYGTARQIEGIFQPGEQVLIIDDLITNGQSKIETLEPFKEAGLIVKDVLVLIDRKQGGEELLGQMGIRLHSFLSVYEILDRVYQQNIIDHNKYSQVLIFLKNSTKQTH
ncbi:MAG: orotate phosphoribosyltransferase [Deltaproteobacteria bacterium]|nr:orotate phosphoribosyltransferase [Deltaproteobacteria bacterium]